jgi:hypothetical protein
MQLKQYFKTLLPRFDHDTQVEDSGMPDFHHSSFSKSSEAEMITKHEKYRTKEDEDVVVFMRLAQSMSVKSLLFLLQNHARAMNIPEAFLQKDIVCDAPSLSTKKATLKMKKFRFAEISGGDKVRAVVHEIPKAEDLSLWWGTEEIQDIRKDAIETVMYFKRYRPRFADSVQILAKSYLNETPNFVLEQHMKKLADNSVTRGLERHIVPMMGALRSSSVKTVLAEQEMCRKSCKSYDETCEVLRSRSLSESRPGRTFADKIAECDHIEALKASLSKWTIQEQQQISENPSSEPLYSF